MSEITFDCYGECNYKGYRIVHAQELLKPGPWAIIQAKAGMHQDCYNDSYYVIKDNWASEKVSDLKTLVGAIDKIERWE